jgi:hypothetical protein
MNEVSTIRLYVMRAYYLLLVVGIGATFWPSLLDHGAEWGRRSGPAVSMLAAVSIFALLGLRYPLKMLPIMLFELVWKTIWMIAVFLPIWRAGETTPKDWEDFWACGMGIVLTPLVVPWGYVVRHYFMERGEGWRKAAPPPTVT